MCYNDNEECYMKGFFQLIINSPKENIESLVIARAMQLKNSILILKVEVRI